MFQLTDVAVKTNETKEERRAALRVAVEAAARTNVTVSSANLKRSSNGSGGKESGGGEELHLEKLFFFFCGVAQRRGGKFVRGAEVETVSGAGES